MSSKLISPHLLWKNLIQFQKGVLFLPLIHSSLMSCTRRPHRNNLILLKRNHFITTRKHDYQELTWSRDIKQSRFTFNFACEVCHYLRPKNLAHISGSVKAPHMRYLRSRLLARFLKSVPNFTTSRYSGT